MFQLMLAILSIQAATSERKTLTAIFTMKKAGFGDIVGPALLGPMKTLMEVLDVNVNWTIIDTNNTPAMVVSEFFSTIDAIRPHVIIGENSIPCCDILASLASATNTLFVSIGCNPVQFMLDRESYPTYTSARLTSISLGLVIDQVMKKFSWTRVAIISTTNAQYPTRVRRLKEDLQTTNREVFSYVHAASNGTWDDFLLRSVSVQVMLEHLSERSTFFVFLMDSQEEALLLKYAASMDLLTGKHAFLFHGLTETLGVYTFDLMPFNGILTADRYVAADDPTFIQFRQDIRSGFEDAAWTNHTKWTRKIDFDSQHTNLLLSYAVPLRNGVMLWRATLEAAKEKSPNLALDDIAKDGSQLAAISRNLNIDGITRKIIIKDGAAGSNWVVSLIQNGQPKSIMTYSDDTGEVVDLKPEGLIWPGGSTTPPKEPRCFVDQCKDDQEKLLIIICCSLVGAIVAILIIGVIVAVLWKSLQEKQIIANWRILWTDVALIADQNTSANSRSADRKSNASSGFGRLYITAGLYKGTAIAIKDISRDSVSIFDRSVYKELKQLLHVKHDNINPFIGICVDAPNVCVAMAYAERGSIQNVLADQQFQIDWEFRMSLALDVAQGMEYLHSTPVEAHGHLTSANCVIDDRWVCKITDYGLKLFRGIDKLNRPLLDLLWTAPEMLRKKQNDTIRVKGTKSADVYSFGVIMSELMTRELPYQSGMRTSTLDELLEKVKMSLEPPFRPDLPALEGNITGEWIDLARNCWQTAPQKRPTFKAVKSILQANHSGKFTNVLERMQMMMEDSIEHADTDLLVERRKTEAMLESILPRAIVEKLSSGAEFEPQLSDSVTLCLCDTIGFYKATFYLPADVVVDVLKSVYQQYDEIVIKYGAFEINTSGSRDSMMLTGGLPINPHVDAEAICTMALKLLRFMQTFKHPRIESQDLKMKTTIHTGSAYSALMGKEMPQLHVFGEVIPTTTHLHSFGDAMVVRISSATRDRLPSSSGFKIEKTEEVQLKDSLVKMYVVTGKEEVTMHLPSSSPTSHRRRSSSVSRRPAGASPRRMTYPVTPRSSGASSRRNSSPATRRSSGASPRRNSSPVSPRSSGAGTKKE